MGALIQWTIEFIVAAGAVMINFRVHKLRFLHNAVIYACPHYTIKPVFIKLNGLLLRFHIHFN